MGELAQAAALTTGAIYARFRDKEALLFALYQQATAEWTQAGTIPKVGNDVPLERVIREFLWGLVERWDAERQLRDAFASRLASNPDFQRIGAKVAAMEAEQISQLLLARPEFALVIPDRLRRAVGMLRLAIGASLPRAVTGRKLLPDHLPQTDEDMVDQYVLMALGCLLGLRDEAPEGTSSRDIL